MRRQRRPPVEPKRRRVVPGSSDVQHLLAVGRGDLPNVQPETAAQHGTVERDDERLRHGHGLPVTHCDGGAFLYRRLHAIGDDLRLLMLPRADHGPAGGT